MKTTGYPTHTWAAVGRSSLSSKKKKRRGLWRLRAARWDGAVKRGDGLDLSEVSTDQELKPARAPSVAGDWKY